MSQVLGGSHPSPAQWQVHSDLSSSSDFDISVLVQSCDNKADISDTEHRSYEKFSSEIPVPDDRSSNSTQQMVSQTMFDKLEKISARSDTLEQKSCKKSVQTSKIKNKAFKKSKQNVEVAIISLPVKALPLSQSVPESSSRGQKIKPKSHMPRARPVVQVGPDTSVPSLQAIKYDLQIQAPVDQVTHKQVLATRSNLNVEVKLMCLFRPELSGPMNLCCLAPLRSVFLMINSQCPSGWLTSATP